MKILLILLIAVVLLAGCEVAKSDTNGASNSDFETRLLALEQTVEDMQEELDLNEQWWFSQNLFEDIVEELEAEIGDRLMALEDNLGILSDKVFGSTTPEYVYIDQRPSSIQMWENINALLGSSLLKALERLWYDGGTLTQAEITKLNQIHWKYPLGYIDFNSWLKQGLRQFYESYEQYEASYVEKEPIPVAPLEDRVLALEESVEGRMISLEKRVRELEQELGIQPSYWR